jgi:type I restriction enzyme R subunit
MTDVSEAEWESVALETLARQEWLPLNGSAVAPGTENGRTSWDELALPDRLLARMRELNPDVLTEYLDQARAAILQPSSQDAIAENYRLHVCLVCGFRGISDVDSDGSGNGQRHGTSMRFGSIGIVKSTRLRGIPIPLSRSPSPSRTLARC